MNVASSARQWAYVAVIVGGLGLGAWALVTFAPLPEGAEVGQRAPDFKAMNLATGDSIAFRDADQGIGAILG